MDAVTLFGLFAVSAMLVCYALEDRSPWYVLGFAAACGLGSIYGFVQGWDWYKSARLGNACGAIVVTRHGCANFMPTYDEVMAFVEARGGF